MNLYNKYILSFLLLFPIILSLNICDSYYDIRIALIKICLKILLLFGIIEFLLFIFLCISFKYIGYKNIKVKEGLIKKYRKSKEYDEFFINIFEKM